MAFSRPHDKSHPRFEALLLLCLLAFPVKAYCGRAPSASDTTDIVDWMIQSGANIGVIYDNTHSSSGNSAVTGGGAKIGPASRSLAKPAAEKPGYSAAPEVGAPVRADSKPSRDERGFFGWVGKGIATGAKTGFHYMGEVPWHAGKTVAKVGVGLIVAGILTLPTSLGFSAIVSVVGVIVLVAGIITAVVGGILGSIVGGVVGAVAGGVVGGFIGALSRAVKAL